MDLHVLDGVTIEEVKKAHMADLQVQHKYGVRYVQFWVNEKAGMVFCLMDGPDKESCAAVHKEASGNIACNLIEVSKGEYDFFLGDTRRNDFHLVEDKLGAPDTAFRYVTAVDLISSMKSIKKIRILITQSFTRYNGRETTTVDGKIFGVFNSCIDAIQHAHFLLSNSSSFFNSKKKTDHPEFELRIGICAGQPVFENRQDFFGSARKISHRLSDLAENNSILLSPIMDDPCLWETLEKSDPNLPVTILKEEEVDFINLFMDEVENDILEHQSLDHLSRELGISRTQLYRKMNTLFGSSPNQLLRELRLRKAIKLLNVGKLNISEVALETGFKNPSYFSKQFKKRFGLLPKTYTGPNRYI
jgi:AraC-like DNA-binding protein